MSILLEILILHDYDIIPVFSVFNLEIITKGKHLQYKVPQFVYKTSTGFYKLDADSCHQKQLLFICENVYTSLTSKSNCLNYLFQNTSATNCHAQVTQAFPPIIYKYSPSELLISSDLPGHLIRRNMENKLTSVKLQPTNNCLKFIPYFQYESFHFHNIILQTKVTLNATVHFVPLNISYSPQINSALNDKPNLQN